VRAGIENFIFDLDGTLVDSLPGIEDSVRFAVSSPIPPLRSLIGPPIRSILRCLEPDLSELDLDGLTKRFRKAYDSTGWRNTILQSGTTEVLAELHKRGRRVFLATNKPARPTTKILAMLSIGQYFAGVSTCDSRTPVFASKTEMLRALLQCHSLDPTRCLMVGDTVEDYVSAVETGMDALIVSNGYGRPLEIPAECRLETLTDLLSLLDGPETRSKQMPGQVFEQAISQFARGEIT
jgi:phosphoglycolate phosphatase